MHNISYVLRPLNKKAELSFRIFNQAYSFYRSGLHCVSDLSSSNAHLITPAVVLCSFSLELYLKTLLEIQGLQNVRGHSIENLYKKLDMQSKLELAKIAASSQINLEKEVKLLDSTFVNWRYKHENDGFMLLDFNNLDKCCLMLHKYILSKDSHLRSLFEKDIESNNKGTRPE